MTIQPGATVYTQGFGSRPENVEVPTFQPRVPATTDNRWPLGKRWIDTVANSEYSLTSFSTSNGVVSANWALLGSVSGALNTLTGDSGGAISPSAGNINLLGTASEITTTGSGSTITLSLPASIVAPGSLATTTTLTSGGAFTVTTGGATITAGGLTVTAGGESITGTTNINTTGAALTTIGGGGTGAVHIGNTTGNTAVTGSLTASTTLTATAGAITATNGNVVLNTAGNKLIVATGANASVGTSGVMSGTPGAVTVATTASSATAKIFYSRATTGGTPGQVSITAQDGTGFTLTSTANETSTFNWWIINA